MMDGLRIDPRVTDHVAIGAHWTGFEPPDIVRLHLRGTVTLQEAEPMNGASRRYAAGLPHFFYLIDMGDAEFNAEVRKSVAAAIKDLPLRGSAIYNASLRTKVLARLLLTAVNLLLRNDNPIKFFDTEREARAWIDLRRSEVSPPPR